jgi:hypothetical protein
VDAQKEVFDSHPLCPGRVQACSNEKLGPIWTRIPF